MTTLNDGVRPIREVHFWQEGISAHTAELIASLARARPQLRVVSNSSTSDCGQQHQTWEWERIDLAPAETKFPTPDEVLRQLVPEPATVHIFCGYRAGDFTRRYVKAAKKAGTEPIIMSEPGADGLLTGPARLARSWMRDRYFRRKAACVLAIGANGPRWFQKAGFPRNRVLPFAYFTAPPSPEPIRGSEPASGVPRIGFLGRLLPMKGLTDLIDAMRLLDSRAVLDIVGQGELGESLAKGSPANVYCRGALPHADVWNWLANIDCLVLPSRSDDGWGVVVSEALLLGVPVITTDKVGASIVLERPEFGVCVRARSAAQLAGALEEVLSWDTSQAARSRRARDARAALSAESGAEYLWRTILFGVRQAEPPPPPWS